MSTATRANCFDASALLKLYLQEDGSNELRTYWNREPTKFTTSLCFYEALTLLKACHFYRKTLNVEAYKKATLDLCAWYGAISKDIPELNFLSPAVFFAAQRTAEKHKIDLSMESGVDDLLKTTESLNLQFNLNQPQKEAVEWAWPQESGDTMFAVVNTYTRAAQFTSLFSNRIS